MSKGATASHTYKKAGSGNRVNHQKKPRKHYAKPTASKTFHPLNKPSNGCMWYANTQSNQPGSKQFKQETSSDGHYCQQQMTENTTPNPTKLQKDT